MPFYTTLLYGFCFLFMSVTGILVLLKDRSSSINRSFFFFTLSTIAWMACLYSGYYFVPDNLDMALIIFRYTFAASILLVFFFSMFFYHFPNRIFKFSKLSGGLMYLITLMLVIVAAFTPFIEEGVYMKGDLQVDVLGPFYWVYLGYCLLGFIFAITIVIKKIFNTTGIERGKMVYASLGFFVFFLLAMMTNVILPIFNIFILQSESVAFSLFFFTSVFYSIYKQRFFNLSFITLNFLRDIIIMVASLSILALCYYFFDLFEPSKILAQSASTIIGFLVFKKLEKTFPNFYSSSFRYLKIVLTEFETKIYKSKSYDEFIDLFQNTFIERLNFSNVKIFLIEKKKSNRHLPVYIEDSFSNELGKIKDVLVFEELQARKIITPETAIFLKKMKELKAFMCFPLYSEDKLMGFFTLGRKPGRNTYGQEEIEEILRARSSIEICFTNIFITNTLQEENNIMKKIIAEKTETLKKYNKELQKMIQQQDNFISLTAHEFRTPLTVSILGLEQILSLHEKDLPTPVIHDIQTSYQQLNKLTLLINRLLEMRRVEDDKISVELAKLDLISFLKDTVTNLQKIGTTRDIHLKLSHIPQKSLYLFSDKIKLQQVLDNLLQNAIKFSKIGQEIKVGLKIDKAKKEVSIIIEDQGPGIGKKDLAVIFEKFQQGVTKSNGLGIGLYLCKEYMKLLKGHIRVKSKLGVGSIFTITFPLETA